MVCLCTVVSRLYESSVLIIHIGAIFLSLAATLHPFYGSAAAYSQTGNFAEGLKEPAFDASIGKTCPQSSRDLSCILIVT